jgi:hypothetical protein
MNHTGKTYTELAKDATDALKAFNDVHRFWAEDAKRNGYSKHFKAPELSERNHYNLLVEVAYFDGEAQESLENIRRDYGVEMDADPFSFDDDADNYDGGRFDWETSRGVA